MTRDMRSQANDLETRTLEMLQSAQQLGKNLKKERELRLLLDAAEAAWGAARQLRRDPDGGQRDTSTDTVGGPTESPPPGPGLVFWQTLPPGLRRHFEDLVDAREELVASLVAEWKDGALPQNPHVIGRGFAARHHLDAALDLLVRALDEDASMPAPPPPPGEPPRGPGRPATEPPTST